MNVRIVPGDPATLDTPLLAVPIAEGDGADAQFAMVDAALGGALDRARGAGDLLGRLRDAGLFYGGDGGGPARVLALGIGPPGELDREGVRRYVGRAVREAEARGLRSLAVGLPERAGDLSREAVAQAAAEGGALAAWAFRELKATPDDQGTEEDAPVGSVTEVLLVGGETSEGVEAAVRVGLVLARAENLARTLQSRPGNVATPTHLGEEARRIAAGTGMSVTVFGPEELRAENMHALLAVSSGSDQEPRLIVLEHRGGAAGAAPLVLVGKGLTFDAGGISLKPAKGMEDMKYDMSGGAAVLAAMQAVAELALPVNVVGIVPSSENLVSGSALKPGDVIRTRDGKTVEVVNTDAEGRLILADALSWARTYEPAAVVDCATLTGACVIALGHHASAVLGTDDALVEELRAAGEVSGERCWPLPLWDDYRKQLDSEAADLMNVGGRPAGTVTAARFLREFVGDVPWAHLDIAGTAYGEADRPYRRKGGHGVPTRLLVEWVRDRAR